MNEFFLKIVNMSISAGWLILAVLILRLILKRGPRWVNVLLWGIVAVRLLCPFSIESPVSLIPSAETVPVNIAMDTTPAIYSGVSSINRVINPLISQSNTPEIGASVNPLQVTLAIYVAVWLLGVCIMLLYMALSYWLLRRRVDTAVILRENIFLSGKVSSPFVLGILRPRIYLPFSPEGQGLQHVIAHEKAHIRRKDHWWKPLGFLLLAVHWFNPLMWLAYALLCRDIELACDEKVIRELDNEQRADYTQALLDCSINRRGIAACPLAFGEVGVRQRVRSVMNYKKPAFWMIVLAVALCVAVAVCFLTDPVTDVENPWVREYVPGSGNISGTVDKEVFEGISKDFAIGADQYGRAVFKEPHKAFETFLELYAQGIDLIREEFRLQPISSGNYGAYKTYGWQTTAGSEEARAQAQFVTKFLDIYENSFSGDPPALTRNDVIALSRKGYALTWADFEGYACQETGSGLYIRYYPIDERFSLLIGGTSPDTQTDTPLYFYLRAETAARNVIDIRDGGVEEFIEVYGGGTVGSDPAGGKTYLYEGKGAGGYFTVTLYADGTFSYYEGPLSSYIGSGSWTRSKDMLTLTDDAAGENARVNRFREEGTELIFVEQDSTNFLYVEVADGERFRFWKEVTDEESQ